MTLSIQKLQEINETMLGLGAPVEIDGIGYNKMHFDHMLDLYYRKESLTINQQKLMVETLIKYSNTQLTSYKSDLKETLEYLNSDKAYNDIVKSQRKVNVVSFDSETVQISWNYNRRVSEYIRESDRANYKWNRDNDGKWILKLFWCKADEYIEVLNANGFDTSEVAKAKAKAEEVVLTDENGNVVEFSYVVDINRPDDSIDTLELAVAYHPMIADSLRAIPYISFNKSKQVYTLRIDTADVVFKKLAGCGKSIDLTQLEPWKKLVESWDKTYDMIDISKTSIPFKPYDFQIEDIQKMLKSKVILNGNDMGCGKTMESVITGESMPMKKLVICPATLRLNWEREIKMINPEADVTILYSNSDFKATQWTIIGYPSVAKFQKELEEENFQCIFIDEAHYCQAINNSGTPDSIRSKAVLRLTATAGWVYPLTGTPKTNRNKNVFNILRMIRHDLAKGQWAFMNYGKTYCEGERTGWGWNFEGNSNDEDLNARLKPRMIRHLKSEVLPNLKKQRMIIPVAVDLREYNDTIMEYLENRKSKEAEQLARLMRARKILATQKVGETIDFAKDFVEQGEKIIIVTCFTEVVKIVEKAFKGNCCKIVGGMSDIQKNNAKEEFQNGKTQVLVMNIVAGGVGLTLTSGHTMIFNDYDWTIGSITQAEDRICRSGQTECCNIYFITAKGADVEEEFVDTLTYKSNTINNAIDSGVGESINFRNLVEKSAGKERSDVVRTILSSDDVKCQENENTTAATSDNNSVDYSKMTMEQIESKVTELGGAVKHYSDDRVTRMRAVMQLKKLMA